MQKYIKKTSCRACGNFILVEVLNLNLQPLANDYHDNSCKQEKFPLVLNLCSRCFHLQLSVVMNPEIMFKNYLYVSGTTKTLNDYFDEFVKICKRYNENGKSVLDIACNDGTQLDKFKKEGWETAGVDPAENLFKISSQKHRVICDFWNEKTAIKLGEERKFDIVIAQNVFAHIDNIYSFLDNCKRVMKANGVLFIQTSQANMILNNEFDTIYHEHLSFFNTKSMKSCLNTNGFSLIDTFKTDIHGGSYVFVVKEGAHDESKANNQIQTETDSGIYEIGTYVNYANSCKKIAKDLKNKINTLVKDGEKKIIGYGAAAKGNTFLNFAKIDLDYIVDDNRMKCGLYTPGRNIIIRDPQVLKNEDLSKIVIVPLAWNFFKEIKNKVSTIIGQDIPFIKYFPKVEVI